MYLRISILSKRISRDSETTLALVLLSTIRLDGGMHVLISRPRQLSAAATIRCRDSAHCARVAHTWNALPPSRPAARAHLSLHHPPMGTSSQLAGQPKQRRSHLSATPSGRLDQTSRSCSLSMACFSASDSSSDSDSSDADATGHNATVKPTTAQMRTTRADRAVPQHNYKE